jgi:hypothetical protein
MAAVYRFPVENSPIRIRDGNPNHPRVEAACPRHLLAVPAERVATQWDGPVPLGLARCQEAAPHLVAESRLDYSGTLGLGWGKAADRLERSDGRDSRAQAKLVEADLLEL